MTSKDFSLAAVDLGSTFAKGALYSPDGRCLHSSSLPVKARVDGASVEHNPQELLSSVETLLDRLRRFGPVSAIGLACQRSTCLLWERAGGRALTPAISWQDSSATGIVEGLAQHASEVGSRTGLRLSAYYAAPKLSRLLSSRPDVRRRAESGEVVAGTLDAFLMHHLTGEPSTEGGLAGRTLLYNLESDNWDPALCSLFDIPEASLPQIRPSIGHRRAWRGIPLTALAGDQQAALLAHGGWEEGVTAAHFGTGAFVLTGTGNSLLRHPGLLSAVLANSSSQRHFQLEGAVNSAGSAMDWISGETGLGPEEWGQRPLEPERLPRVLPALAGLATPWWRPEIRTVVQETAAHTSPRELADGVLVGVAMRVVDCFEALAAAGATAEIFRLSGKLTRSRALVDLIADLAQVRVEVSAEEEPGLAGIARLAAAGLEPDSISLSGGTPAAYHRDPEWPPDRAHATRSDWKAFVNEILGA
ncbi:MAG: FGGY family carbohydrate kinase [Thermoanaerobaculia bacterium]|jgi:glycerol kinase